MDMRIKEELRRIANSLGCEVSDTFARTSRCFALFENASQFQIKISHTLENEKVHKSVDEIRSLLEQNGYLIDSIDWKKYGNLFTLFYIIQKHKHRVFG